MQRRKQETGDVPVRVILGEYFAAAKRYAVAGIFVFVFYSIGILFKDILAKLTYRSIFDTLTTATAGAAVWPPLFRALVLLAAAIILANVFFTAANVLIVWFQTRVLRDLENKALEELQQHSYSFFVGSFIGSLVAKAKRFARSFEAIHDRITFVFWITGVQLLGVLGVLAWTMPSLAVFFALWCIVYIALSYAFARVRLRYDLKTAEADSAVTGQLADILTNILNLKMFSAALRERRRFGRYTEEERRVRAAAWNVGNVFHGFQGAAGAILEIVGMTIAVRLWLDGTVSAGTVVMTQTYFIMVINQTWDIGRALSDVFRSVADAKEFVAIVRTPVEVRDPPFPAPCRITRGDIAFHAVGFGYGKERSVFSDFSLMIPAGQRVGIVGHSGGGKSTLMKLLLRFLDVQEGSITIDNRDIRQMRQDDLRAAISFVPQDPILFHRSLYENIAYARPDATGEEVIAAARRAHAHEFIERLPKGYDTLVGERGVKLSGGERQRVAIARVILKNSPMLLLDEATSSLDSMSEHFIQEQLKELMERRTTLAIAHRISTIRRMDRIIVLAEGRIAEDGTHDELLAKDGLYAQLWQHQSQGFLVEERTERAEDPLRPVIAEEV